MLASEVGEKELRDKGVPGERIGEYLSRNRLVRNDQVYLALAQQFGVPFVKLRDFIVARETLKLIPGRFARQHTVSLITVDIDRFKIVNDTWSHATGDTVLKNLAQVAAEVLRKDDLFGRIGGEEFSVLLPGSNLEDASILAERLRSHVESQAVAHTGGIIRYTISAGVVLAGDESPDSLLQRADRALYAAKRAGRNQVARG